METALARAFKASGFGRGPKISGDDTPAKREARIALMDARQTAGVDLWTGKPLGQIFTSIEVEDHEDDSSTEA